MKQELKIELFYLMDVDQGSLECVKSLKYFTIYKFSKLSWDWIEIICVTKMSIINW